MSSFKFSPRQEYAIQKVKAQLSSGKKLKFSPSKNTQLSFQFSKSPKRVPSQIKRQISQSFQLRQKKAIVTGHLVYLDRSNKTFKKIQKQPWSSQSPLQEQESIMKQPCSNTKPVSKIIPTNTNTSAFSPQSSSKKKLYKHLYQQVVDTESAEVISNLQDQIDGLSNLLKQGVDNSRLIHQIESIVRQSSQERQRMLSEQEVQEIKSQNEQLREEIQRINEQLNKPNKVERNNLDLGRLADVLVARLFYIQKQNPHNIDYDPFSYFEKQYKMLDWRRSAYTKRK